MMKCPACGTENLDSSQFCDECGASLKTNGKQLETPNFQAQFNEIPNVQSASVTSFGTPVFIDDIEVGEKNTAEANGNQRAKGVHATLLIERGASVGMEFQL